MKGIVAVCLVSLAAVVLSECPADQKYTDRYDNTNVEEVIANPRLFEGYSNCILDKVKKCTPEGKELKDHLAHALQTGCECCTEQQKTKSRVVIGHLINEKPELWAEAKAKYDPDNKYSTQYEADLRKLTA